MIDLMTRAQNKGARDRCLGCGNAELQRRGALHWTEQASRVRPYLSCHSFLSLTVSTKGPAQFQNENESMVANALIALRPDTTPSCETAVWPTAFASLRTRATTLLPPCTAPAGQVKPSTHPPAPAVPTVAPALALPGYFLPQNSPPYEP